MTPTPATALRAVRLASFSALLAPGLLTACADVPAAGDFASAEDSAEMADLPAPVAVDADADARKKKPLAGYDLYVDPTSNYSAQASLWRASRPLDAVKMDAMAAQPTSIWIGDWTQDVAGTVDDAVSTAGADLVSFVVYNIPYRDCGAWSAGGAADVAEYDDFIADFATGLNGRRAIVVLEPDALALEDCLSDDQVVEREDLMANAVDTLTAAGARVYLDAGDSAWVPAAEMADHLIAANIAGAAGFALNVSHTETTTDEIGFANELRALVGPKHFIVDTSRNGVGPTADHQWCNPLDRAVGTLPTTQTAGVPGLDAYLWVKPPGESDGSCNGGPVAGAFWADYALELADLGGL